VGGREAWIAGHAPDGLAAVDQDGIIKYVNEALNEMTGYTDQVLVGQAIEVLVPPHARHRHIGLRERAADEWYGRTMGGPLTVEMIRSDGALVPVDVALRTVEVDGERMTIVAVRDDTERRRLIIADLESRRHADMMEAEARSAGRKFHAGFIYSPNPMMVIDYSGRILEANDALCMLVGESVSRLIGRSWQSLLNEQPKTISHNTQSPDELGGIGSSVAHVITADGSVATLLISHVITDPDDAQSDALVLLVDVTDRVAENAVRDAQMQVLDSLARRRTLRRQLEEIIGLVEGSIRGAWCLVYRLDGETLECLTPETAPAEFREQFARVVVEEWSTPCGHAVATDEHVALDYDRLVPEWRHMLEMGALVDIQATAAHVLRDHDRKPMGTLSIHLRESTALSASELSVVARAVELAEVALGQDHLDRLRHRAEEQVRFQARLLDRVGQAVAATDADGVAVYWNRAAHDLFGWSTEEVIGRPLSELFPYFGNPQRDGLMFAGAGTQDLYVPTEFWAYRKDGTRTPALGSRTEIFDDHGALAGYVHVATDIAELHRTRQELVQQAQQDPVTNLPNRRNFEDTLSQDFDHLQLFVVSVNRFDAIVDTRGHGVGDEVLVAIANRLVQWAGGTHSLSRVDGGMFAIVCECSSGARSHSDDLHALFQEPFVIGGIAQYLSVSIGASRKRPGIDTHSLLAEATAAARAGKDRDSGVVHYFDSAMRIEAERRLLLEQELRGALSNDRFRLAYQPQIDLQTGHITGVEALLRWDRSGQGLVSPAEFIESAEDSGLIVSMGQWALRQACIDAAQWVHAGRPMSVSVNFSTRQLMQPNWVESVSQALDLSGLPPEYLCLEVTESVLLEDTTQVLESLSQLRTMGVGLHIDDFGTGYSSLSYLRFLPVTGIKIDRSFVRDGFDDLQNRAVIAAIISLAEVMDLQVIAEGVELGDHAAVLKSMGCTQGQGHLWSAALPNDELLLWLEAWDASGRKVLDGA